MILEAWSVDISDEKHKFLQKECQIEEMKKPYCPWCKHLLQLCTITEKRGKCLMGFSCSGFNCNYRSSARIFVNDYREVKTNRRRVLSNKE